MIKHGNIHDYLIKAEDAPTSPSEDLEEFFDKLGTPSDSTRPSNFRGDPDDDDENSYSSTGKRKEQAGTPIQWLCMGDNRYQPASKTVKILPSDIYNIRSTPSQGIFFDRMRLVTDELLRFPESKSLEVLDGIKKFWDAKEAFKARKQVHKRGVLLWGPPGSGKTATIALLIHDLVASGGVVFMVTNPTVVAEALRVFRKVEPTRPLICVMEDIDELIQYYGETEFLNLLDGENQVDNVCHIATTNYPDKLDQRFVNRPSRFDELPKIGMPSAQTRRGYLRARINEDELTDVQIERWVKDTDGFSMAHLKEIVISVFCLGNTYENVIGRLKIMKSKSKFKDNPDSAVGF